MLFSWIIYEDKRYLMGRLLHWNFIELPPVVDTIRDEIFGFNFISLIASFPVWRATALSVLGQQKLFIKRPVLIAGM